MLENFRGRDENLCSEGAEIDKPGISPRVPAQL